MEALGHIFAVAATIYDLCDKASSNKKQCHRLKKRIQMLVLTAESLNKQQDKSASLKTVVKEMATTLENAACWVNKYSDHAWWKRLLQANGIKEEFDLINDRLGDAATQLSLLMAAEHRGKFSRFFTENTRKKQNEKDIKEDLEELRTYLHSHVTRLETEIPNITNAISDLRSKMDEISVSCSRPNWNITEIRATDLKRGDLMLERVTHSLYRGELHHSPVAIKVFKYQNMQSEEFIRKTFESESKTMKKFECMNILRLYGIFIDNSGPETCYSLVMELCEKGTLRELLQAEPDLPWDRRVVMALDVTRALYRLHQTEVKAILHGSLSSIKFLVDEKYCVKLSGFELSKTESSIRRPPNLETRKKDRELEYIAPETWQDINEYNKHSEIYSLGVVIYEIATGKQPFQDLEVTGDNLQEMQETWWASVDHELPSSCPRIFRDLIKRLIHKNPRDRPSAGASFFILVLWFCVIEVGVGLDPLPGFYHCVPDSGIYPEFRFLAVVSPGQEVRQNLPHSNKNLTGAPSPSPALCPKLKGFDGFLCGTPEF
ncbi:PREDICTED: mixed lineage kinase domain-like protein [Nanorana parkeri]|uniref:mixed lineage kinase domain-like protein n=1 Tax=Nanorana parkeri TaxID=125878 RepID=UPI0008540EDE|nr:PREDICTED: mixed lineage kinase domain-like protein [Nanorana parkeri]